MSLKYLLSLKKYLHLGGKKPGARKNINALFLFLLFYVFNHINVLSTENYNITGFLGEIHINSENLTHYICICFPNPMSGVHSVQIFEILSIVYFS